jgi:hypothetical protein
MRLKLVAVAGLVCLLGVIGGTMVANAGSDITSPETFTLVGTTVKDRFADVGKPGPSPGDVVVFVDQLKDEAGADVGKARIQCTFHVGPWAICTAVFRITDRGDIVAAGLAPFGKLNPPPFDVAVTGGTGDFANVRGEIHVEVTKTGERDTLELIP